VTIHARNDEQIAGRRRGIYGAEARRGAAAKLLLMALGCLFAGWPAAADPAAELVSTCSGADWSLPRVMVPMHDSGFFTMDVRSRLPQVAHEGHTLTWAELQPEEDRTDFSSVHEILRSAASEGRGVVLRLKASVTRRKSRWGPLSAVPEWVLKKHAPRTGRIRDRGPSDFIEVVVPWDPGVQAEYLRFLKAVRQERFDRYPSLLGLYVHGISSSFGEEMWMSRPGYRAMVELGLTPQRLEKAMSERLRAWADVMAERPGLLAWVGAGWIDASEDRAEYRRTRERLDALALELGLGRRWGNIEKYNGAYRKNGQVLEPNGRLRTDSTHPLIAERRYWGAENENYDRRSAESRFVYRMALLRALQMDIRLLWVTDAAVSLDPALSDYYVRVAGREEDDWPDAWVLLREVDLRHGKKEFVMGNFERGLAQIEPTPRAKTLRELPIERPPQPLDRGDPVDWTARRTGRASGSDRIELRLDDRFIAPGKPMPRTFQLTWRDDGQVWHLEVHSATGSSRSATIRGAGGGQDRTTTLLLPEALRRSDGPEPIDFSLVADEGDLIARRVRVLKDAHRPVGPDCRGAS
jgi:hypothetical protein